MLRAAKHLEAHGARPFAALRACPERSEWGDKKGPSHSTTCTLCSYAQPPSPSEILDLCLRLMHIGRLQGLLLLWTGLGCDFVAVGTLASPSVLFLMPHRTCPPWATQGSPPHIQTSPVPPLRMNGDDPSLPLKKPISNKWACSYFPEKVESV